ncbi:hypothetical protein ONZ45_g14109 [Pleurotus djamor]|nr:hypothetical protein ONZ45_g14109 [Pleurotus djamor]
MASASAAQEIHDLLNEAFSNIGKSNKRDRVERVPNREARDHLKDLESLAKAIPRTVDPYRSPRDLITSGYLLRIAAQNGPQPGSEPISAEDQAENEIIQHAFDELVRRLPSLPGLSVLTINCDFCYLF